MWSPTHVQVTVQRAKGLLTKGKNSTNNCFVTIALGKEKYQTSVRDKASQNVEWHEECELAIPDKGNTAELILTCLHHNNLGIDEFLGQITLPLRDMDAYDRPRSKWFKLQSKPGQEKKDKERGELEVRINFTVKAGSLTDLSKKEKHKSSFTQLASSVGGSLLSIGTLEKKKGFKKIATSIGSKLHLVGKKKDKKDGGGDNDSFNGSTASIGTPNSSLGGSRKWNGRQYLGNTDPGVPEDDDSIYDQTSRRSSNHSNPDIKITQDTTNPSSPASMQNELKTSYNTNQMGANKTLSVRNSWGKSRVYLPIPEKSEPETNKNGAENERFEFDDGEVVFRAKGNQDPGVIEDDDEFVFDKLSHKSSGSSLNIRGHNEYNNQHRVPSPVITKEEDNFRTSTKISLAAAPPAKPPRNASDQKLDEWESKLYGNHLEIGSSDSLKRRSWGNNRIPLNTAEETEEDYEDVKLSSSSNNVSNNNSSSTSATTDVFTDVNKTSQDNFNKSQQPSNDNINVTEKHLSDINKVDKIEKLIDENNSIIAVNQTTSPSDTTATTSVIDDLQKSEKKESKIEKLFNKSPLLKQQTREKLHDIDLQNNRNSGKMKPKLLPRSDTIAEFNDDVIRNTEDTKEIRERLKKDQKEISEKTEKIEKKNRFAKFKYFNKRMDSKADVIEEMHGERHNPIGHENFNDNQNSLPELSPELLNKYDGKSREDIILIADSLEKEMITERNRVKELEEYLDNLLLRVMETHPKILQNPYRTASTKRFSSFSG